MRLVGIENVSSWWTHLVVTIFIRTLKVILLLVLDLFNIFRNCASILILHTLCSYFISCSCSKHLNALNRKSLQVYKHSPALLWSKFLFALCRHISTRTFYFLKPVELSTKRFLSPLKIYILIAIWSRYKNIFFFKLPVNSYLNTSAVYTIITSKYFFPSRFQYLLYPLLSILSAWSIRTSHL